MTTSRRDVLNYNRFKDYIPVAAMKKEDPEYWKIRLEIIKCSIEPDCWDSLEKITRRMLHVD